VSDEFVDLTDDLVEVKDGETLVNSRQVAFRFERKHKNVIQNIEELLGRTAEISAHLFYEDIYLSKQGKPIKQYLMNRKGFFMLVSSFKSATADEWKSKFYDVFEVMEKQLKDQASAPSDNGAPKTYLESLKQLVAAVERNEELEAEHKVLVETVHAPIQFKKHKL
jgi:Rha family phage regulatory protein